MLAGMEKKHGARPTAGLPDVRPLADLGISHAQSQRWQAVAGLKETFRCPPGMERCLKKLVLDAGPTGF